MQPSNDITGLLSQIREINGIIDISFEDRQDWQVVGTNWGVGEMKMINGTFNIKVIDEPKHLSFITILPPGSKFPKHWHSFKEVCGVISGTLGNEITGREYTAGQKMEIAAMEKHTPLNPSLDCFCCITVDFYK